MHIRPGRCRVGRVTSDDGLRSKSGVSEAVRSLGDDCAMPFGPLSHEQFEYERTPPLFFGRIGWGPLILTLDTNLLIHLAQNLDDIGGSFGLATGFSPDSWGDPVCALRDLFALWFSRDVRFYLPPAQMHDGRLDELRWKQRQSVLDAFAQDFWQRGGATRGTVRDGADWIDDTPLIPPWEQDWLWPPSFSASLPAGADGVLIAEARKGAAHAFLTADKGVLARANALAGVIRVLHPGELLAILNSCGELVAACAEDPLIPDLQSLAHFYSVIPQD
jgi:hypothetical protein